MAENEKEIKEKANDLLLNRQNNEAKERFPNDATMLNSSKELEKVQQENKETEQEEQLTEAATIQKPNTSKIQQESEETEQEKQLTAAAMDQETNTSKIQQENEEKEQEKQQTEVALDEKSNTSKIQQKNEATEQQKQLIEAAMDQKPNTSKIQQENEEPEQEKEQFEVAMDQKQASKIELELNEVKQEEENDKKINQKLYLASISFEMRRKVVAMELNTIETFFLTKRLKTDNDKLQKLHTKVDYITNYLNKVSAIPGINYVEVLENDLLTAENLSTELMKKIKKVYKENILKKEEVKDPVDDIEVPDYRSIVTIRGTNEDVIHCILKAEKAFKNGKYDRAESLLLKAERIFPTKNARNLLKQVRSAKEPKYNPETIEIATETVEQVDNVDDAEKLSLIERPTSIKITEKEIKKDIENQEDSIEENKDKFFFKEILKYMKSCPIPIILGITAVCFFSVRNVNSLLGKTVGFFCSIPRRSFRLFLLYCIRPLFVPVFFCQRLLYNVDRIK